MFSILIPVYNTAISYIEECFNSINNQTFQDFEVIIVDDGSEKPVKDFLNLTAKKDSRYKVFYKEHSGISETLNYGLKKCTGNLVARMDSDDIMMPNRLQKQYDYFSKNKIDILGSQIEIFGKVNYITAHPLNINKDIMIYSDWFMNHPSIVYKKETILNMGGYHKYFDGLEDLELWCRALAENKILHNMNDTLVKYRRLHDNPINDNIKQKIFLVRHFYANIIGKIHD